MRSHKLNNYKFIWKGKECIINGEYYEGTPDVWYLSNGDPGYQGDPSELDIASFSMEDYILSEKEIEELYDSEKDYYELLDIFDEMDFS